MTDEKMPKRGEKMLWLEDENQEGVTYNGYPLDEWDALTRQEKNEVKYKLLMERMNKIE